MTKFLIVVATLLWWLANAQVALATDTTRRVAEVHDNRDDIEEEREVRLRELEEEREQRLREREEAREERARRREEEREKRARQRDEARLRRLPARPATDVDEDDYARHGPRRKNRDKDRREGNVKNRPSRSDEMPRRHTKKQNLIRPRPKTGQQSADASREDPAAEDFATVKSSQMLQAEGTNVTVPDAAPFDSEPRQPDQAGDEATIDADTTTDDDAYERPWWRFW